MGRRADRAVRAQVAVFDVEELSRRSQEILEAARKGEVSLVSLADPLGREIIYGPRGADDFIEVTRPE